MNKMSLTQRNGVKGIPLVLAFMIDVDKKKSLTTAQRKTRYHRLVVGRYFIRKVMPGYCRLSMDRENYHSYPKYISLYF